MPGEVDLLEIKSLNHKSSRGCLRTARPIPIRIVHHLPKFSVPHLDQYATDSLDAFCLCVFLCQAVASTAHVKAMSRARTLNISVRAAGNAAVVDLEGAIDLANSVVLRSTLFEQLRANSRLALNMSGAVEQPACDRSAGRGTRGDAGATPAVEASVPPGEGPEVDSR